MQNRKIRINMSDYENRKICINMSDYEEQKGVH